MPPKKQRLSKIKEARQRALQQIKEYKQQTGSVPKIVSTFPRKQLPYDKAIRKIGGKRRINIEGLIDALRSSDPVLKQTALNRLKNDKRLLQLLKNPKYSQKLLPKISLLLKNNNREIRFFAIEVLGHIQTKESFQLLSQLAKDELGAVRQTAAQALGHIQTKESFQLLSNLANDRDWTVRQTAAQALGNFKTKESFQLLSNLVNDRNWTVRKAAAQSLGNFKTKESLQLLSQLAKDNHFFVRKAAAQSLGNFKTKESLQLLSNLANDKDISVRQAVAQALGNIKPKETLYPLNQRKPFATTSHLPEILKKAKTLEEISKKLKQKHKDKFIGIVVFGSYAKGYATPNSDVDYAVIATNKEIATEFRTLSSEKLPLCMEHYVNPKEQTLFEPLFYGLFFGDRKLLKQAQKQVFEKNFLNNPEKWETLRRGILENETNLEKSFERFSSSLLDKQRAFVAASLRTPPPYNEMLKILKLNPKGKQLQKTS